MKNLSIALVVLTATGCATTGKTAAQRVAEIERYRQQKSAEAAEAAKEEARKQAIARGEVLPEEAKTATDEAKPTNEAGETPSATPATPATAETTNPAEVTPAAPATPALPVGPRTGLFGIRANLLGSTLALGDSAGTSSSLGLRYFLSDAVGVNLNVGFAFASVQEASVTGLSLGFGLNVYGGTPGKALRPFFALEGAINQVGTENTGNTGDASASALSLAAGGGLEYWLAPQLSVNTTLLVGLAFVPDVDGTVIGTFQPGLGVTLYTE
ncbi:hypothetical protein JQX13_06755 [Archangium violaceum]|uniref:hypothetical protein n=1 Tax=Archangium violaceum TaxID=83451 RepID=UPI00193C7BBD|nr:hypothetical protein [Archangium violaceum]QRK09809.1 hypothetical protein JQX13_06755 [Archangium violaceum]